MDKRLYTRLIKAEARRLGFDHCGISEACFLEDEAHRLEQWLKKGMHGEMSYMERNSDKRLDPRKLMPGARSVISLLLNYWPGEKRKFTPKISVYALGEDYHFVIRDMLNELLEYMRGEIGMVEGRGFVDSAPVMERAWAVKSGLGWTGKNANLITKRCGSYHFIAELIVDAELEYDRQTGSHCGKCTACMDACPTHAITSPGRVDGSKCISYLTIEKKGDIPESFRDSYSDWIFGCDICQEVCTWNRFASPHHNVRLSDKKSTNISRADWKEMDEEEFDAKLNKSPLQRTGLQGMRRNVAFIE